MNEQEREPLTDSQLSSLLKKWSVAAPADLEGRVMRARGKLSGSGQERSWWRFLLKGYIRVPVPVICCLTVLMVVMVWRSTRLAVACVGENSGLQAIPAIAAKTAPAPAARSVGACTADSKC
jgi:hypothetical protein